MKNNPRKSIIIFDCAHADSHVDINSKFIDSLKGFGNIFLLVWGNSYSSLSFTELTKIKKTYLSLKSSNAFLARFINLTNTLLNSFYIHQISKNDNKEYILIGHEIISLAFCYYLFPKGIYLMHHMQIDELKSSTKRFFFGFYKKRVIHVVMADYIKDHLVSCHDIPSENIRVVPHPLYDRSAVSKSFASSTNNFIALNYSNSEPFIDSIIQHDIKYSSFYSSGCKLIIKSKFHNYQSPGLTVFNGYLSRHEYDQLYTESDAVLSVVDSNFIYRIGGTMIDAISCGKPVIAMRSLFAEYYHSLFGDSIILCEDLDAFIDAIIKFKKLKNGLYYSTHSIEHYNILYKQMISNLFLDHSH